MPSSNLKINPRFSPLWEMQLPTLVHLPERPDITRGNKTVLATLGFKTSEEMMLSLGKCLESPIVYTQVDMDTYDALFPGWGKEMGLMVKYFEALGENAWTASGPGNHALIKAEDLDLHVGKELESWEDAMSKKNWKSVFA
ncbi:unnamed protein product [Penicillium camemberti]|uniref:Str. FM013 n=1 Tax=Penicillium camemberti (strain FM 013) TaxID=1429867 RepID=A0A0G4NWK3_PENC3|nr:unnamed protein product [Penicillium camemberti]